MRYDLMLLWALLAGINKLNWRLFPCEWDTGPATPLAILKRRQR